MLARCLFSVLLTGELESTGGYERTLTAACHKARLPITQVQPQRVRAFAKAEGLLAKTDRLDARLLARFGARLRPAGDLTSSRGRTASVPARPSLSPPPGQAHPRV